MPWTRSAQITNYVGSRRAAQYVRMSTDNQKYSTANQAEAIAAYAESRNITIVRTYADDGLSGLGIKWRNGLKALIADVESGRADFDCVLVYDISRWGRFQDIDESAYYEFICRRAGIAVHYCADEFENDGSLASLIIKNVKRAGAADYSRQLSKKVFLGQSRITRLGFWRGGFPPYGLRRQLIEENGTVRTQLEYGQRKYLQTDRIRLVHGPEREVETVRRIFRSFVSEGKYLGEIAAELNATRIQSMRGLRWSTVTVGGVIANETYTGAVIFNRSSYKLKQKRVDNPRDEWVRKDGAFSPIVSPETYAKAQAIMLARRQKRSDQEAIDRLKTLGREKGHLTGAIIAAADDILSVETYRRRFGSLVAAYELAGYQPEPRQRRGRSRDNYRMLLGRLATEAAKKINDFGGRAEADSEGSVLRISEDCRIALGTARAVAAVVGGIRWEIRATLRVESDLTLIARMDAANEKIVAYYLVPTAELAPSKTKPLRISSTLLRQACRYENLDAFCRLCAGLDQMDAEHETQPQDRPGQDLRYQGP